MIASLSPRGVMSVLSVTSSVQVFGELSRKLEEISPFRDDEKSALHAK
jgi:hypothetical protein